MDDESTQQSQSSRSSTPSVSNPGTPRSEMQDVRATPPLTTSSVQRTVPGQPQVTASSSSSGGGASSSSSQQAAHQPQSKYSSLLAVIEDMGRDIRPTYAGNRTSSERLKRSIVHARILPCRNMDTATDPNLKTLQSLDTELFADSVEWCPFNGMQDVLLCGTYQLLESTEEQQGQPQVRVGQLQVYHLQHQTSNSKPSDQHTPSLSLTHRTDTPGILDIKWARRQLHDSAVCGLVNAQGEFCLWRLSCDGCDSPVGEKQEGGERSRAKDEKPACLESVKIGDCLGLSLDWAASNEGSSPKVVVSDSKGGLSVIEVASDVTVASQWHAHDYEAWICAFDQWNSNIIYSGSDDCKLKVWDLRVGTVQVQTNSRFTMGVCSIQSNPLKESLLAVGSYDENVRVFDTRNMRQPLSTTSVGGGVWRVKWDPFSGDKILTASMHNGFHVVDCSQPDCEPLPVLGHYTNHKSLAYGVDWCRLLPDKGSSDSQTHLLASCSFYDHSLQLWQWTYPQN